MSVRVPSVVEDRGGVRMTLGSFPYLLCKHVGYMCGWSVWVYADVVGSVVQCIIEQSNRSELIGGSDVGVTEKAAVEVGEELW